tara:strand:+ start:843 stop:1973 length:1131 start_codon:yes stop_codon:yes gene_type:complete
MTVSYRLIGMIAGLALLSGCQVADDILWPSLAGEDPAGSSSSAETDVASSDESILIAPLADAGLGLPTVNAGAYGNTGTTVSERVRTIASELGVLQAAAQQNDAAYQNQLSRAEQNAQRYYATIAAITSRLQIGTTPGNPILVSQYNVAQTQLDQLMSDVSGFNTLGAAIASNAATSAYISDAIDATLRLSGAVEEDHRQLHELQSVNNRTVVGIETSMNALNSVVNRQSSYVNTERTRMAQLAVAISNGQLYGPALVEFGTQVAPTALNGDVSLTGRQPLVVIRFDRDDVAYQDPLYQAFSAALQRKPDAVFDLVAVAPAAGTTGDVAIASSTVKRNAEEVMRTLAQMGLPADRVSLSSTTAADAAVNEVRIFVR